MPQSTPPPKNPYIKEIGRGDKKFFIWFQINLFNSFTYNRPFSSSPRPLFENEGKGSAFDMEIYFHSHANNPHFHKKGCAPSLILKVRVFGTRKWPIHSSSLFPCNLLNVCMYINFFLANK